MSYVTIKAFWILISALGLIPLHQI